MSHRNNKSLKREEAADMARNLHNDREEKNA
jgi:hypothetical protein